MNKLNLRSTDLAHFESQLIDPTHEHHAAAVLDWERTQRYLSGRLKNDELNQFESELEHNSLLSDLVALEAVLIAKINNAVAASASACKVGSQAGLEAVLDRIANTAHKATNNQRLPLSPSHPPKKKLSTNKSSGLPFKFWQAELAQKLGQSVHHLLNQPISSGVSILAICATIGVSATEELTEPIYRTLSDANGNQSLTLEQLTNNGYIARITFKNQMDAAAIAAFVETENLKVLVGTNANNQILVSSLEPVTADRWTSLANNPLVEKVAPIDSSSW